MADHKPTKSESEPLHKVGVMWKPKPGAKSLAMGFLTINGLKQHFLVLHNRYKSKDTDPDYTLMSSHDPEVDQYATRSSSASDRRRFLKRVDAPTRLED